MNSQWQFFSYLQAKVFVAVSCTFLVLFLGQLGVAHSIIMRSYTELEFDQAKINAQRLERAFSRDLSNLNAVTKDWAIWDDTYTFVQTGDIAYVEANLTADTFKALSLNLIAIFDNDKTLIYGRIFDLETEEQTEIPASLLEALIRHPILLNQSIEAAESVGFVQLDQKSMLVARQVILTSNRQGPAQGHILMAQFFGESHLSALAETTRLPVESFLYGTEDLPNDVKAITAELTSSPEALAVQTFNDSQITSYALISDLTGKPALVLQASSDRDIYARGKISLRYYFWSSLLMGAGFCLLILLLLRCVILSRLETLSEQVTHIGKGETEQDLIHLSLPGQDELARLANTLNWTLRQLHQRTIELQNTQQAAELAKDLADRANRAKSTFLANMSHELRTPLNAILGVTQLLERDRTFTPEQHNQFSIISDSGEHLLSLINDVLDMAKIETGCIKLNPSPFDLYELLATLENRLHLKAESKGIQLILEATDDIPQHLIGDSRKLRQILINLLSNAIEFTSDGYVKLTVKHLASPQSPEAYPLNVHLQFSIEDTGVGIAVEELPLLFEPFIQAESGRQSQKGTGLELPISRKFVELMGGELVVDNRPGQGTVFTFAIQAELAKRKSAPRKKLPQRMVVGLAADQPSYRILVVDDQAVNRKLLLSLLRPIGFELQSASNGQAAIEIWEIWRPHLIWMDLRMPIMDGVETTRRIRAMEASRLQAEEEMNLRKDKDAMGTSNVNSCCLTSAPVYSTKIIALTASSLDEVQTDVLAAGFDDFVGKQFQRSTILNKIAEHLQVSYCYEDEVATVVSMARDNPLGTALNDTQVSLAGMPPIWLEQLRQAAVQLRSQEIINLIAQIPPEYEDLQHLIKVKVDNFDFDQVLALVNTALNT